MKYIFIIFIFISYFNVFSKDIEIPDIKLKNCKDDKLLSLKDIKVPSAIIFWNNSCKVSYDYFCEFPIKYSKDNINYYSVNITDNRDFNLQMKDEHPELTYLYEPEKDFTTILGINYPITAVVNKKREVTYFHVGVLELEPLKVAILEFFPTKLYEYFIVSLEQSLFDNNIDDAVDIIIQGSKKLPSELFEKGIGYIKEHCKDPMYSNYLLGISSFYSKKMNDAEKYLKKAIEVEPNFYRSQYAMGKFLVENNKYKESLNYLKKAIEISKGDKDQYLTISDAYIKLKNFPEAIKMMNKAIIYAPKDLALIKKKADIEYNTGEWDSALKSYNLYLSINSKNPYIYEQLGKIYEGKEKFSNSAGEYNSALDLIIDENKREKLNYKIAELLTKAGSVDQALNYYDKIIENNKNIKEAQLLKAQIMIDKYNDDRDIIKIFKDKEFIKYHNRILAIIKKYEPDFNEKDINIKKKTKKKKEKKIEKKIDKKIDKKIENKKIVKKEPINKDKIIKQDKKIVLMVLLLVIFLSGVIIYFIVLIYFKKRKKNKYNKFIEHFKDGNYNDAIQIGLSYISSYEEEEIQALVALCMFKEKRYKESLKLYEKTLEMFVDSENKYLYLTQLGELSILMLSRSEALKYFQKAISIEEKEDILTKIIKLLKEEKNFSKIIYFYKKLEKCDIKRVIEYLKEDIPKVSIDIKLTEELKKYYGHLLVEQGNLKEACKIFKDLYDQNPKNIIVLKEYAKIVEKLEDTEKSIFCYKKLLLHSPIEEYREKLSYLYSIDKITIEIFKKYSKIFSTTIQSPEQLISEAQKNIKISEIEEVYIAEAIGYYFHGNYNNSLNVLEKGLKKFPMSIKILEEIIKVYDDSEKWEQGLEFCNNNFDKDNIFKEKAVYFNFKLNNFDKMFELSFELLKENKFKLSLLKIIDHVPEQYNILKNKVKYYFFINSGKLENAEKIFKELKYSKEEHFKLLIAYSNIKNYKKAISGLMKFIDDNEFKIEAVKKLANIYFETNDTKNAILMCKKMLEIAPERINKVVSSVEKILKINPDITTKIFLGELYFKLKKYLDSVEIFENIVNKNNKILSYLTKCYLELNENKKLYQLLNKNTDILIGKPEILKIYAEICILEKDHNSAIKATISLLKHKSKDSENIIEQLEKEFEKNKTSLKLVIGLSEIFCIKKHYDKALLIIKKSPLSTKNKDIIMKKAEIYTYLEEYDKALNLYGKLYDALKKKSEKFYQLYTELLIKLKKYKTAVNVFKNAFKEYPEKYEYAKNIGIMYEKIFKFNEAKKYYEDLIKTIPNDLFLKRAVKRVENSLLESKIQKMEKLSKENNLGNDQKFELAEAYFKKGFYENAVTKLQLIDKDSFKDNYRINYIMGLCFINQGMYESAKSIFNDIDMNSIIDIKVKKEIMYSIGSVYEDNKLYNEASIMYQKIIAEDMNYKDCKMRISKVSKEIENSSKYEHSEIGNNLRKKYKDFSLIKVGGMGRIYKAFSIKDKKLVAIKILADKYRDNPEAIKRFIVRDGLNVKKLDHPNIVKVLEVNEEDVASIVLEYVEGDNILEILKNTGNFSEKDVIYLGKQILSAISYAHSKSIIHRDIKPENIMVDDTQRIKILDFGLARQNNEQSMTKTGATFGTIYYMSPEQLKGNVKDLRSDIYSLGVTFYEMLTGKPPFTGDLEQVIYSILHKEPKLLTEYKNLNISKKINAIIEKCMKKDIEERYSEVSEILADWDFLED